MTFHIARGPSDALKFYAPFVGHEPWSADRAHAHPFASRACADDIRGALYLAGGGETLMVLPVEDGAGGPQVQHHAGSMRQAMDAAIVALHESGALTRANVEAVGREVRLGPGPNRPRANGAIAN